MIFKNKSIQISMIFKNKSIHISIEYIYILCVCNEYMYIHSYYTI